MRKPPHSALEFLISFASLLVILFYSYQVIRVPYLGFQFDPADGQVYQIWRQAGDAELIPGDRLVKVGQIPMSNYIEDTSQSILGEFNDGKSVPILLERQGRQVQLQWSAQSPKLVEILTRFRLLWLPYIFWLAGTATLFLLRPKDARWRLLTAVNYLTALWLATGLASQGRVFYSSVFYHMIVWISIPVYLHLHWMVPESLGKLPRGFVWSCYSGGMLMAAAEWFHWIPSKSYFLGFLIALLGSLVLLGAHMAARPEQRKDLRLLSFAILAIALPSIPLQIIATIDQLPLSGQITLLSLPLLPLAYFYTTYKRQLGDLELRANRIIIFYLYSILLFSGLVAISWFAQLILDTQNNLGLLGVIIALAAGLFTTQAYPRFTAWAERRLLGSPTNSARLLEEYTTRITTSLDLQSVIQLIRDECLPALLIRQAALIRIDAAGKPAPIFCLKVSEEQLPTQAEIPTLLSEAGKMRALNSPQAPCPWARLVLALSVNGQSGGLCLLGRRDPDDYYASNEIPTLQALINATTVALINIEQADRLRWLYQTDIERQESERSQLALELHDGVLSQLAILAMNVDEREAAPQFQSAYTASVNMIREIIAGLRPGALSYGLWPALEELADEAAIQAGPDQTIEVDLPPDTGEELSEGKPPEVDLHLFRIVQQAVQNAIAHSGAQTIRIVGSVNGSQVCLEVCDNGRGFLQEKPHDLSQLLANKHFGLAGMHERAALIGAKLEIDSQPGAGVRVRVCWAPTDRTSVLFSSTSAYPVSQ